MTGVRFRIKGTQVYVTPQASASPPLYDAAAGGRRAVGWRVSSAGPNAVLSANLQTLRNRSRDAVRQNARADAAVSAIASNVVGTGIVPVFDTGDEGLNRELGELFLAWTDEADADGGLDFYGQQALAVRGMAEGGEVFGRLRRRRAGDLATVPLQVQLLEPEYVPHDAFSASRADQVQQGIRFDALGRRTAYLMYRQHPFDWSARNGLADLTPMEVPAGEVLHLRDMRRPGQLRGEPWATRALIRLRDLDQYDDAQLVRQKLATMLAGFIRRKSGATEPVLGGEGAADPQGVALAPLEPAMMQYLDVDEEITFTDPPKVDGYADFVRQQVRGIAVSMGVLYEQVSADYSQVNDRMWRASVQEFRRRCEMWQHHVVVFQWCRPVMRAWLQQALLAGIVKLPRQVPEMALHRVRWAPQRWPYIHPVQDVQSDILLRNAGFESSSSIIARRGERRTQVYQEIADEEGQEAELALTFPARGKQQDPAQDEPASDRPGGRDA